MLIFLLFTFQNVFKSMNYLDFGNIFRIFKISLILIIDLTIIVSNKIIMLMHGRSKC